MALNSSGTFVGRPAYFSFAEPFKSSSSLTSRFKGLGMLKGVFIKLFGAISGDHRSS